MSDNAIEGEFYGYMQALGHTEREWNRRVLEFYLPYFARCEHVLDVGCGEGQMIELLSAEGVSVSGIDSDAVMVQICRERGLDVIQADLLVHLSDQQDRFDGIFSSNVVEHLTAEQAMRFVDLAFKALRPGGILLIATPNPESLIVHRYEFWRDATHVRMYNRQLLEFLLYRAGLRNVISGENPRTAWTPPSPLKLRLAQQRQAMSDPVDPSLPQMLQSEPIVGTVWRPPEAELPTSVWRRLGFRFRRRLAHFLARSVLFEEFATVEQRLAAVDQRLAAVDQELAEFAASFNELSTRQVEPLRCPREAFGIGVKPLVGGEVLSLPEAPDQPMGNASTPSPAASNPRAESGASSETSHGEVKRAVRQPRGALKIAVFTPYLPYPPDNGGKIRSYHLLRALTERFDVDLYSVHHGAEPVEAIAVLREYCCQVVAFPVEKSWRTRDRWRRVLARLPRSVDYFCTPDSLARVPGYLRVGQYDLVIADEICMSPYAELAPHLPRVMARQKVDHLHYSGMARARRWGSDKALDMLEASKLRRYEQAKMPFYQAFVACSAHDAQIIGRDAGGAQALVIPNGVDLSTFQSSNRPRAGEQILLYVGSMDYYPNIDAMMFFFESMYDRVIQALPNLRLQIVGHSPPPEIRQLARRPGVEVVGGVPDMRPYLNAATMLMVPLRLGGGTRLKIVEATAMGLPVVSTSVGAEGLDIHPGQDILIADDASLFAEEVLRLFTDAELRARLSEGGRRLATHYDWRELTRSFADLAENVVRSWRQTGP